MKQPYRRTQYNDKPLWNSDQIEPLLDQDGLVTWPSDFDGYNGRMRNFFPTESLPPSAPPPQDSLTLSDGRSLYLGWWVRFRYRRQAAVSGTFVVAKRLRKQGWPLHVTLMVLL